MRLATGWQHGPDLSIIKQLYFTDRLTLIETGVPITGDTMVAMPYGPVLSLVKDCLNSVESFGAEPPRVLWRLG